MMFGDVGLFADKEYFDEHPYGNPFFLMEKIMELNFMH